MIWDEDRVERNQQDATNLMFIMKLLSQHVSGIIMPIIRRTRPCTTAYGVPHWLFWPWLCGACRTPYAVVHGLVLPMMGIMMPETCWDRSFIINIRLVASCWFLSLHPTFMMHGHKSLKYDLRITLRKVAEACSKFLCRHLPQETIMTH